MTNESRQDFARLQREIVEILPNLRRYAMNLCRNLADADDLMQLTVERVLQAGKPDDAVMEAWCFRICRNLWIDEVRARKVRIKAAHDPELAGEQLIDGEDTVLDSRALEEVSELLGTLAEGQREVLYLVAVEGYSYKEVAGLLEVPIGTVMSRLARARATLADRFPAEAPQKNKRTIHNE